MIEQRYCTVDSDFCTMIAIELYWALLVERLSRYYSPMVVLRSSVPSCLTGNCGIRIADFGSWLENYFAG